MKGSHVRARIGVGVALNRRAILGIAAGGLLLLAGLLPHPGLQPVAAQDTPVSAEQQLVDAYAPIVTIKEQPQACNPEGEQFRPVVVDILFGTDDVRLMRRGEHGKDDVEIKRNIQASDLFGLDASHYIDLPFDPRNPGCNYEKWGKQRMAELGLTPSIYAFVLTEPGKPGIVVQYWYYWIYNLFNDVHESDWEGIQVYFADATSVQDILDRMPDPTSIGFAQHAGGEAGHVGQDKVEMQGTHVVTHPSSGSHADYYESAIWLGWGEDGSGFGCDHSETPDVEIPVHVVLLPNDVPDPTSEFGWLTFEGNWGAVLVPSLFSGPKGPMQHERWHQPVTWTDEIRESSIAVPVGSTIGPGISQVFCGAATFGSRIVQVFGISQKLIFALIAGTLIGLLLFTLVAWRYTWQAIRMYFRHGYFFITVGVLAFPIAAIGQKFEDWVQDNTEVAFLSHTPQSRFVRDLWEFAALALTGSIQEVLLSATIGPIAIIGTYLIFCAESGHPAGNWHTDYRLYPRVMATYLLYALMVDVMLLTIVLTPLAIYKGVQWFFAPQAVVIENAGVRAGFHQSKEHVDGRWIRAAAMAVAVAALIGLPGPLVGMALLVREGFDLQAAQWVSAVLYCVLFPLGMMAATLFYLTRTIAPGSTIPYTPSTEMAQLSPGAVTP